MLVLSVTFVALHLALYTWRYQVSELTWLVLQLFGLEEENNLPTWFASFLLLNNTVALLGQNMEKESLAYALATSAKEGDGVAERLVASARYLGELRTQPTILIKIQ
jgi:hypothetical protein